MSKPIKATIARTIKVGETPIKTVTFKKDGNRLLFKVNGKQWDTCIDMIEVLCEMELKLKI